MNIIIPASGIGTRFIECGYEDTKPLIQVTPQKKILDYVLDSFDRKNDMFYVITSKETYDDINIFLKLSGIKFKHILTKSPKLGPIGAIVDSYHFLDKENLDDVIISYCDYGIKWNYEEFLEFVKTTSYTGIIPCYSGYHPHLEAKENAYAACKSYDDSLEIYKVIEKYHSDDKFNEKWSAGLYYFRSYDIMKNAFKKIMYIKDTLDDEYYVSMAYNYIDGRISVFDKIEEFYQLGAPREFEIAKHNLIKRDNLINDTDSIKNTIILSAGQSERFFNLGYKQPKPFIPLGESDFIHHITKTFKNVDTNIRYIGSDKHDIFWRLSGYKNVKLIPSNKIGAAYSYKEGCYELTGETLILPCDLLAKHINSKFKKLKEVADAIIFTSEATKYTTNNPNSFTWVESENNKVTNITIKKRKSKNQTVLIGSFWIRENSILLDHINKIFENKFEVNGEYYLDNAFVNMVNDGLNVRCVNIDYFSLGTPSEYNENKYWLNGKIYE
jgi:NDP-sugar pyrophosphorylase family protein